MRLDVKPSCGACFQQADRGNFAKKPVFSQQILAQIKDFWIYYQARLSSLAKPWCILLPYV